MGLLAGVGMREWPYLKMAQPGSYRSYLQILECVRKIGKTCNQFIRYAVGGLVYFLTPNVAFDIRAGGGLTQDAARFLAGVGFVLRY